MFRHFLKNAKNVHTFFDKCQKLVRVVIQVNAMQII